MSKRLTELPDCMAARAILARTIASKNPDRVVCDNNILPWVFAPKENVWLSFDGNYSKLSPAEKARSQADRDEEYKRQEHQARLHALKRFEEISYWSKVRLQILERDNYECQLCDAESDGPRTLHIHHILKRSEGGKDYFDNLLTVCPVCHKTADRSEYNPAWCPVEELEVGK